MQAGVSGVELSPVCTCVPPSKRASKNTGDSKGQLQDRLGSEGIRSRCVQGWAELATEVEWIQHYWVNRASLLSCWRDQQLVCVYFSLRDHPDQPEKNRTEVVLFVQALTAALYGWCKHTLYVCTSGTLAHN